MSKFLDSHLKELEKSFAGRELDVPNLDAFPKKLLSFPCSQKAIRECGFWVILNVRFFGQEELKLTFEGKNLVLYAKHHYRDIYGIRVQRDFIYTYEIPDHIKKETLHAVWTADDYLVIMPDFSTTSSLSEDNREVLVPVRIPEYLSPKDRLPTLLEIIEETSLSLGDTTKKEIKKIQEKIGVEYEISEESEESSESDYAPL